MQIIDLSHTLTPDIPVYPGTRQPQISNAYTIDQYGFAEKELTLTTHTGTHIDAPAHLLKKGKNMSQLPLDTFIGKAMKINLTNHNQALITIDDLQPYTTLMEKSEFILLQTGFSQYWHSPDYFKSFPTLTPQAAKWLGSLHLKGIGIDTFSVDTVPSAEYPIHKILLDHELVIIENLTNLGILPQSDFLFIALPLKIKGSDGSPIRAGALII